MGHFKPHFHFKGAILRVGFIDFNQFKLEKTEMDSKIKALAIISKAEDAFNKFDEVMSKKFMQCLHGLRKS